MLMLDPKYSTEKISRFEKNEQPNKFHNFWNGKLFKRKFVKKKKNEKLNNLFNYFIKWETHTHTFWAEYQISFRFKE